MSLKFINKQISMTHSDIKNKFKEKKILKTDIWNYLYITAYNKISCDC